MRSPDFELWLAAIAAELKQLFDGGTLVAETPTPRTKYNVIHSTMPMRCKTHQDGSLSKFKARLCACGNELSGYIADVFSPTINALTYSAVHQIAIIDEMSRCIMDVVGAYLY